MKFVDATLVNVNLFESDLSRADLSGADLTGADLENANLYGADLGGADLTNTILCGAVLVGADMSGAIVDGTVFCDNVYDESTIWPDGVDPERFDDWLHPTPAMCRLADPGGQRLVVMASDSAEAAVRVASSTRRSQVSGARRAGSCHPLRRTRAARRGRSTTECGVCTL